MFNYPTTTRDRPTGSPPNISRSLPPPYNTVVPGAYNLSPLPHAASERAAAAHQGMSQAHVDDAEDIHRTPVLWQRDPNLPQDIVDVLVQIQNHIRPGGMRLFNKKMVRIDLVANGSPGQYHLLAGGSLRLDSAMRDYTLWQLGLTQELWNYLDQRHAPNTPGPLPGPRAPGPVTSTQDGQASDLSSESSEEATAVPTLRPECDEVRTMSNHEDDAEPCESGRHRGKPANVCSKCYEDNVHRQVFQEASQKQRNILEFQAFFPLCRTCQAKAGDDRDDCQCFDHTRSRRCAACLELDVLALTTDEPNKRSKGSWIQLIVNTLATGERSRSGQIIIACPICDEDTDPEDDARWCAGCTHLVTHQYYTNILGSALPYEAQCAPPGWVVEDKEV